MKYLIPLLLSGCASPQWVEIEPNVMRMYSMNPDYTCRKQGLTEPYQVDGCHVKLGDTHFIIYRKPSKFREVDKETEAHEKRHITEGDWHD